MVCYSFEHSFLGRGSQNTTVGKVNPTEKIHSRGKGGYEYFFWMELERKTLSKKCLYDWDESGEARSVV